MRKRILFLSQCLPFPPHSGVTRRTYHILQELQREFDVTLVAFSRRGHQPDAASVTLAAATLREELSDVMTPVPIKAEFSLARKLGNHAWSLFSRKPYVFYEYGDGRFGEELRLALRRASPEMIHLDSMDLYRWLPSLPMLPTTCTHHNVESDLLRLGADHASNPVVRGYINQQAGLTEKVERRLCPRLDLNVMTSDVDAARLRAIAPTARTTVVPNGVDVDFFRPGPEDQIVPGRLAFLGPTYMYPNRDAVDFFLASAWGIIRRGCPESTLHLIGKNPNDDKARFESSPGVTCNGHVPDIRPHLAQTAVSIVPIRLGGGTRLKILDSWSMGKAVVSTSVGCEGLETIDGHNILIRDEPAEFAAAVLQVLRDRDLRNRLGREGRRTAEEHYAWRVVGQKLIGQYENLIIEAASSSAR
jgi:glycosyltransferase involved in cell wall biosynthesis